MLSSPEPKSESESESDDKDEPQAAEVVDLEDLLKEDSIIILETDSEQTVENQFKKLSLEEFDKKKYGRVNLLFYKNKFQLL